MLWSHNSTVLRLLALLALSEFVRTGFFVAFLPLSRTEIGLTAAGVGLIVGLHYLADGLAKGPVGVLTDRFGLGRMALAGALAGSLAVLFLPSAPKLVLAPLISLAWGLTLTTLWPGVMTAVSHFAHDGKQSRALSVASLASAPAIVLGALGVGVLMQRLPDAAYPLLVGAQVGALVLALSLVNLKLPRGRREGGRYDWRRVAGLIPAAFAQTLAPGLLVTIFFPLLAELDLTVLDLVGPGLLAGLVGLLALPLVGRVADRAHPRRALLPGLFMLALTFALLGMEGAAQRLYIVAPLGGLAYALFLAGWNGLVARTLPQAHRTAAWGTIMAVEALGYAIGPILGGLMWDRFGAGGPFWLGAVVLVLVLMYYLLPAHYRQPARPATSSD